MNFVGSWTHAIASFVPSSNINRPPASQSIEERGAFGSSCNHMGFPTQRGEKSGQA